MYNYKTEKQKLFTEKGQEFFLDVRDRVKERLKQAGAFRFDMIRPKSACYDSWELMAAIDRLVELKEIVCVRDLGWHQYRVYSTPQVSD